MLRPGDVEAWMLMRRLSRFQRVPPEYVFRNIFRNIFFLGGRAVWRCQLAPPGGKFHSLRLGAARSPTHGRARCAVSRQPQKRQKVDSDASFWVISRLCRKWTRVRAIPRARPGRAVVQLEFGHWGRSLDAHAAALRLALSASPRPPPPARLPPPPARPALFLRQAVLPRGQ